MPSSEWAEFQRLTRTAGVTPRVAATVVLEQRRRRRIGRPAFREHGTERGYQQHKHRGEDACRRCLSAHSADVGRRALRAARAAA